MKDPTPTKPKNDWRDWLADVLGLKPEDRDALLEMLNTAGEEFVTQNEMRMIRGVLKMREWRIRDVMVPFGGVNFISINADYQQAVALVRETQHSRYPVLDERGEEVCGILLAKDLLSHTDRPQAFSIRSVMRKAVYEPTTKPLDSMLEDFRTSRSHMVVVLDEHAHAAGIITIEDVLEKIVGEIEDESDDEDDRPLLQMADGAVRVSGTLSVEEFNQAMKSDLPSGADSIAGWLAAALGRMPQEGDTHEAHGLSFHVAKAAGARRVHHIVVRRLGA